MKKDRKYHTTNKSKKFRKANIIYICSVVTMFAAIGAAVILIPKNASQQDVPVSPISSFSSSSRRSSKSSQPEIRPIQSSDYTGIGSSEYSSSNVGSSPESSSISSLSSSTATKSVFSSASASSAAVSSSKPPVVSSSAVSSASQSSKPPVIQTGSNSTIPPASIPVNTSGSTSFVNGIAIVGTRAMSLYGASSSAFKSYAQAVNKYKEALPDVNVYCMIIPTACEFYGSAEVNSRCASQREHINIVINDLKNIKSVDAYSALAAHLNENIYLRTDHHWAALGGYYAAREFAKAAGVPFLPLSDYTEKVNTGYVGTMLGYTNNSSILKNNPENFVYHVPKTVDWETTYYNFKLSGSKVTGVNEPMKAAFFLNYGNNRGDNYCTFMGGDAKIVHVKTSTKNGRKLAIFKESFGNPIPGYLFGSFEEIYVLDERYFPYNAIDYIKKNGITDLLFANCTVGAGNPSITAHINENRTQANSNF